MLPQTKISKPGSERSYLISVTDNDEEDDEFFIGSIEVEVDDTLIINDDSNCYSPDDDDVTATVVY